VATCNGFDVEDMRRRWKDGWSASEIARHAGCLESTVYALRDKFSWPDPDGTSSEPLPPSIEDARLSEDSLALSPWVKARADEIRAQRKEKLDAEPWVVTRTRVWRQTYRARTA
jgi:hypothetical protein